MRDSSCAILARAGGSKLRRALAIYALGFLAAVAVAPHRHLNSFEDLVSDGRSDSGVFVHHGRLPDPASGPAWTPAQLIDDDPCLACFHNDWATEPIAVLVFAPPFRRVCPARVTSESLLLPGLVRPGRSRSPPASA